MKIKRRIEIELRTEKVLISGALEGNCGVCGGLARVLTIDQAARIACTDSPTIFRQIQTGRLHSQPTASGLLVICLTSLWAGTGS